MPIQRDYDDNTLRLYHGQVLVARVRGNPADLEDVAAALHPVWDDHNEHVQQALLDDAIESFGHQVRVVFEAFHAVKYLPAHKVHPPRPSHAEVPSVGPMREVPEVEYLSPSAGKLALP